MDNKQSKFGTIIKRETLSSSKLPFVSAYLVLNSNDPFPGYYCSTENPADNSCKEDSYYIPIDVPNCTDNEYFCRISLEIQTAHSINICPAWFNLEEKNLRSFRVKGVTQNELPEIFEILKKKKLRLYKHKEVKRFLSYIHLKEFFELRQIDEQLFQNTESAGLYYFTLPAQIPWDVFEQIITYQKSKSKFKNFDAAMGFWMEKPLITDFIRIYGINLENEQLKEIQRDYIRNMKKYLKQGMLI